MEVIIAVISGVLFALQLYYIVFFRLKKRSILDFIDWFLIAIASFNGLAFCYVVWATHAGRNPAHLFSQYIMSLDIKLIITYVILNCLLTLSVFAGWKISDIAAKRWNIKSVEDAVYLKNITFAAWFMFIVAVGAYLLYTLPYGGFISYLSYSRSVRSGVISIYNPFSFLHRFGGFSFFASYVFFGVFLDKRLRKKNIIIGLILSFIFSVYVLYSWVGRVALVVFILTFLLGYVLYSSKTNFVFIRNLALIFSGSILLLVLVSVVLRRFSSDTGIIGFFAKELSFPLASFSYIIQFPQYRWFVDLIAAPLYLLPMKIWSGLFNIETASSFITFLIGGVRKGEAGAYGEIPVDMLTFSYMQLNIIGIIVVGLVWGLILYMLQRLVNKIPIKSIRSMINANLVLNVVILSVLYGDPQHIIVRNFYMIAGLALLWLLSKIDLSKINIMKTIFNKQ